MSPLTAWLGVCIVWLVLAAGPAGADDLGTGQQATLIGRRIVAIGLMCAAPIDAAGLTRLLPMHIGDALRSNDLAEARRRLTLTDLFTDVAIDAEPRGDGVAVIVRLVRRAIIDAIRFRGNYSTSDTTLRRATRLQEGTPLAAGMLDYAATRIREYYAREGFEQARIDSAVNTLSPGEVNVVFDIHEGPPTRIERIDLTGELPLAPDTLRAAMGISAGDRYVKAKVQAAEKALVRLLRTHRFYEAEVNSSWEAGTDGQGGTLRFDVDAGPPFVLTFTGNQHLSDHALLGLMDLLDRPIITDGTWRELARRARHAYQEDGYYFATVEVHVESAVPEVVRYTVDEGLPYHVAAVRFEGNRGLSAAQLRADMQTRPPSWIPYRRGVLLDDVLDDDLRRLWYLYRRHGFESAEIVDAKRAFDRERRTIVLTIIIDEGQQTIVGRVEHVGLEAVTVPPNELKVRVGEPLDPDAVQADRRAWSTALLKAGYARAEVTTAVESQPQDGREVATVRFTGHPGERERVGAIIVQNNIDTRARVILREVPFKTGDPLDLDALLRAQSNIYSLGLFRTVTVRPLETESEPGTRDVAINVSEKMPGILQWGGGYNTRDGFRGFLEIGYNNLQGLGRRVTLRGDFAFDPSQVEPNEYLGDLGFREPRLLDTRWSLRTDVLAQRATRHVDQYSIEREAFIPAIERRLLPGLQAGMEMQVENAQIFDVASDVRAFNPRDEGHLLTVSVGPYAVYDGRDDAFLPRRGVFDSLRLRYAPSQLGSEVPFVKLTFQHSHYIPLNDDLTLIYAARGGWARTTGSQLYVPIRERFFLGGRTTVRGFGENDIGPQGAPLVNEFGQIVQPGGDPLGGEMALNLNTELRFPIIWSLGGAVFVDGGGVYLHNRPVRIDDFRRSMGPGLRYNTPVGPLSLDYGFKLDRRSGESVGAVSFSIGTFF